MNNRIAVLVCLPFILVSCQSQDNSVQFESQTDTDEPAMLPDNLVAIEQYLMQLELAQGNWIGDGGAWICEGSLVRFDYNDFCTSEIPNDWVPFEFDGRTYYVQPLAGR